MTTKTNDYGQFLRDALAYQIGTYDDNGGGDSEFARASVFADVDKVLSLEGDTVTVNLVGTCALSIEPTEYGFVVLVPHEGDDEITAAWQSFVFDALALYMGYGILDDDDLTVYGDAVAEVVWPAVGAISAASDHIDAAEPFIYLGDVQDDQDYATVEFRPTGLDKE